MIERLNYSTKAIEDLKKIAVAENPDNESFKKIINLLDSSIKFILPNKGEFIDKDDFSEKHFGLLKLPFSIIALECTCIMEEEENINKPITSTKRIALAWEKSINDEYFPDIFQSTPFLKQYENKDGIFVLSVNYIDNYSTWITPTCAVFIPYENRKTQGIKLKATELANSYVPKEKQGKFVFACEPAPILKNMFQTQLQQYGETKILAGALADNSDEAFMVLQTCAVINCSNVILENISAPEKLNKSRVKKKKAPFYEYKVLTIEEERKIHLQNENKGTHASPKTHLRRGHIRQLQTGKTIWVRPAMINANKKNGYIDKTYNVNKI